MLSFFIFIYIYIYILFKSLRMIALASRLLLFAILKYYLHCSSIHTNTNIIINVHRLSESGHLSISDLKKMYTLIYCVTA